MNPTDLKDLLANTLASDLGTYTWSGGQATPAIAIDDGSEPLGEQPQVNGLEVVIVPTLGTPQQFLGQETGIQRIYGIVLKQWDITQTLSGDFEEMEESPVGKVYELLMGLEEASLDRAIATPRNGRLNNVESYTFTITLPWRLALPPQPRVIPPAPIGAIATHVLPTLAHSGNGDVVVAGDASHLLPVLAHSATGDVVEPIDPAVLTWVAAGEALGLSYSSEAIAAVDAWLKAGTTKGWRAKIKECYLIHGGLNPRKLIHSGTATVSFTGFVAGDYSSAGLKGDGSSKWISNNFTCQGAGIPYNNAHMSIWASGLPGALNERCLTGVSGGGGFLDVLHYANGSLIGRVHEAPSSFTQTPVGVITVGSQNHIVVSSTVSRLSVAVAGTEQAALVNPSPSGSLNTDQMTTFARSGFARSDARIKLATHGLALTTQEVADFTADTAAMMSALIVA